MRLSFVVLFSVLLNSGLTYCQSRGFADQGGKTFYEAKSKRSLGIKGRLVDKTTQFPIEYGSVSLILTKDSTVVAGGISDNNGYFFLNACEEEFFIKIEFLAYRDTIITIDDFAENKNLLDLGIIELVPVVEFLEGIEVREEKSTVMMRLDKRIFNVGSDLVSEGGTVEDILRNVPGVWVDINGNVSLRSNEGARVLLNGQTSLLLTGKNSDGLRQIQANSVDYIEVITNPSSRYEAEGTSGIINIVLKEKRNKGFNGALSSNIGMPDNFGFGGNMNYRKRRFNFFSAAGVWSINRPGKGSLRNRFFHPSNPDSTFFSNMDRTHNNRSTPVHFKVGADYYLNPTNVLTGTFSYRGSVDENSSELNYRDGYGSEDTPLLITERNENEIGNEDNLSGFLRHRKLFSEKEHQLTTDIRYESDEEVEVSNYNEVYFNGEGIRVDTPGFFQVINSNSSTQQLIIKSDYVKPFGNNSKLETGFQCSYRLISTDYSLKKLINGLEYPDSNFNNDFKYSELIHGAYANYGGEINNFSYQAGLRSELSDVESGLAFSGESKFRNYIDLFPSLFFSYDLGKDNGVQLSYSRRIERPKFLDLSPFFSLRDRRNIWRGNPEIRPEYTDAFELGYINYWEKGTLSAIAYFRLTDNVIKRIQRIDDRFPGSTLTQTENLDFKRNYGVELTYALNITDWWKLNGDVNFFHSFSEGIYLYNGEDVYVGGKSFSLRSKTINRFTFWEKLNSQLTFSYSAPRRTTQGLNRSILALDLATSIDCFKNNVTITLSVSDLFNSRRRRSYSEDETFYSEDDFLWRTRAAVLSFHYRINQHKKQSQVYSSPIKEEDEERF